MLPDLPAGMTAYPVDPAISLGEFERRIALEIVEVAGTFDLEGRLALQPRSGRSDLVAFDESEAGLLEGCIVTHNHPDGHAPSAEDAVLAAERNLTALRTVVPGGIIYELTPLERGWPPSDIIEDTIFRSIIEARREIARHQERGSKMREHHRIELLLTLRQSGLAQLGVRMRRTSVWEKS